MEKTVFDVPALWADHHVLKVREALVGLDGVETIYASSAWKQVLVTYDPDRIAPEQIQQSLVDAGYPIGEGGPPILSHANAVRRDPQWKSSGVRSTETNMIDLEMSGEFRRY